MSDSAFAGFADDITEDVIPSSIVDNTYLCELTEAKINTAKDGRTWLILNWSIIEDGKFFGEEVGPEVFRIFSKEEFENSDREEQVKMRRARRDRIQRLESLGIPADRLSEFGPEDIKGKKAYLTVRVRQNTNGPGMRHWIDVVTLENSVKDTFTGEF